jgi:hypothetical protein
MTAPMALDYTIFFKHQLDVEEAQFSSFSCDLLISAFNSSGRVNAIWEKVRAREKHWIIHNEYGYTTDQLPTNGLVFTDPAENEAEFILNYLQWAEAKGIKLSDAAICVDLTGFMRPQLMFLIKALEQRGVVRFDALYGEPVRYLAREETIFAVGAVTQVRQVAGFEGLSNRDTSKDLLIIGSGYDHQLIAEVAEHKERAAKVQIFGLPSLRADFYQENVLRAHRADDALGDADSAFSLKFFAPANDPFVTASVVSEIVRGHGGLASISNLYLSPLATKPQVLGFALFYLGECKNAAASVLFPFAPQYAKETSVGVARCWRYEIELPVS